MIQSVPGNLSLLHASPLSNYGVAERPGEAEHDGDSDDLRAAANTASASGMSRLPSYLGTQVNTLA